MLLLHKDASLFRRSSDEDIYFGAFSKFLQDKKNFAAGEEISIRGWEKSQYFTAETEWISPPRAVYLMTRTGVCSECICVCVCVCCAVFAPEVVCVCVHGCVKEKFRRHPSPSGFCITVVESHYPSWALWEFHQCVTSHLFTRLCGLHRVEQSRASPADTHRWPCNILRPVCVKTVQGIKLSKLQFSHFSLFCLSCPQLSDIYSVL